MIFDQNIDVKHKPYCGPRAISALTGAPISRIEKMIRRGRRGGYRDQRGRRIPIRGTYTWEVLKVLKRLGCKAERVRDPETTLGRFMGDTSHIGAAFLVEVTGHFTVTYRGQCSDPIPKLNRRVRKAWRINQRLKSVLLPVSGVIPSGP